MNYYPFHIGDYIAHTAHLSPIEDIAYRRLLDLYYQTEGALTGDVKALCRLIRMREYEQEVSDVLAEFFSTDGERWLNDRCDSELQRMTEKQTKARASAEASVNARKAKAQQGTPTNDKPSQTNVERTLNERSANVELPTPTPTPTPILKDSVTIVTGGEPPSKITDPNEIIFGYGIPLLVTAGTPDKQARSFLGGLRKSHGDTALVDALRECLKTRPLQPLEWLAAALPPPSTAAKRKTPAPENFESKDYGTGVALV